MFRNERTIDDCFTGSTVLLDHDSSITENESFVSRHPADDLESHINMLEQGSFDIGASDTTSEAEVIPLLDPPPTSPRNIFVVERPSFLLDNNEVVNGFESFDDSVMFVREGVNDDEVTSHNRPDV